ncbi:NUDIX domain-containing protein [Anderseniella sp. Alg231-50]|uniref:NUDIX domain-containing protein n=1 Tax=Anderseniella sp. Alg231-50 TaxID=1922226 RepID=UPI000D54F1E3
MLKSVMFPIANRLLLQPLGRLTRGMTLGTRGVIRDADGRMLVVRQRYTHGWIFPGGGVDRGEAPVSALKREVVEETGVRLKGDVAMHGLFSNHANFPGDYVAVYIATSFEDGDWKPSLEITERAFLDPSEIAGDCSDPMRRRLQELDGTRAISEIW